MRYVIGHVYGSLYQWFESWWDGWIRSGVERQFIDIVLAVAAMVLLSLLMLIVIYGPAGD